MFLDAVSIEVCGIGTTRRRRPAGAIPLTALENRVKMSITIDPTVGSRSNYFHEFLEAIVDGVMMNGYDTATASGRTIPPKPLENRVKRSITLDPTIRSCSNVLSRVSRGCF